LVCNHFFLPLNPSVDALLQGCVEIWR
jgi:hypothetical protein